MRRPNKPHIDGYEDEEDCEGYYDPDEAERRNCHPSSLRGQQSPDDPCEICFQAYLTKDRLQRQAKWDAKTPEEKKAHTEFLEELRKLR